jgi:energy-converting hydrogenase Eha subunit G
MDPVDAPKDIGREMHWSLVLPVLVNVFAEVLDKALNLVRRRRRMSATSNLDLRWPIDACVLTQAIHEHAMQRGDI